jgi:cytochrome P450 PksS
MDACPFGHRPDAPLVKLVTQRFMQDPYPELSAHRDAGSAVAVENGGFRMWLVTGYEDVRTLLADPLTMRDVVSNRDHLIGRALVRPERKPHIPRALRVGMIDRDGHDHHRLRGVVSGHFTRARIAERRPAVEAHVDRLLRALPTGEPVDLVQDFAQPVAAAVVADLLGLEVDATRDVPRWVNSMLTGEGVEDAQSGAAELIRFTRDVIKRKRAEPGADLTTDLTGAAAVGTLSEIELESTVALLVIAGMEPASTISSCVYSLLRHPDQLALLRAEPGLLRGCIEEVIRHEGPFRMLPPRYREQPYRVGDVTIPAREFILLSSAAANRDPAKFPDPDHFDIRRDTRGHLGFSHGAHRCLGAELGRLEVATALGALLTAFPDFSPGAPWDEIRWRPGTFMRRLYRLPVVLGRP